MGLRGQRTLPLELSVGGSFGVAWRSSTQAMGLSETFMCVRAIATTALIAFFATGIAQAEVYKCKTADGMTVYQQIACNANENETGDKVKAWPQPSQADVAAAQYRLQEQEDAKARAEYEQALLNSARAESQTYQTNPASGQPAYAVAISSGPCPPSQVPLNASRADPTRGWSSSKGYVPLRCGGGNRQATTSAAPMGPGYTEPKRIQDQHGNWYNQPPGSSFATDERTGKQCFVYGNFVRCD